MTDHQHRCESCGPLYDQQEVSEFAASLTTSDLFAAAQGVLDAWDADAMPEEDGFDPMVYNIETLRAAVKKVKK